MEHIVKVENLTKLFPVRQKLKDFFLNRRQFLHAVDGLNLEIKPSQILMICGESGCGKTTTGLLISKHITPTSGKILFKDVDVSTIKGQELKSFRRKVQMVFQDPFGSLDPRYRVENTLFEPLLFHKIGSSADERFQLVCNALENVELTPPEEFLTRYPHELSGGEKQRVALARVLVLESEFIIADEPVSMIDSSIRSGILNLLLKLRNRFGLTLLFITHDMSVARYLGDRVAIMYTGKIVEEGPKESIILEPKHPYTKALRSAVPVPDPMFLRKRVSISGEPTSPIDPQRGCRFYPRCPIRENICKEKDPVTKLINNDHLVACHIV